MCTQRGGERGADGERDERIGQVGGGHAEGREQRCAHRVIEPDMHQQQGDRAHGGGDGQAEQQCAQRFQLRLTGSTKSAKIPGCERRCTLVRSPACRWHSGLTQAWYAIGMSFFP